MGWVINDDAHYAQPLLLVSSKLSADQLMRARGGVGRHHRQLELQPAGTGSRPTVEVVQSWTVLYIVVDTVYCFNIVCNNTLSACILFAPVKRLRQKCEHYINCQVSTIMHFPAGVGSAVVGGATPRNKTQHWRWAAWDTALWDFAGCTVGFVSGTITLTVN